MYDVSPPQPEQLYRNEGLNMRTEPESWFIHNLIEFREDLNANPEYQRPPDRWSKQNEQLLIDSILRGYDIPKLYFAEASDTEV